MSNSHARTIFTRSERLREFFTYAGIVTITLIYLLTMDGCAVVGGLAACAVSTCN